MVLKTHHTIVTMPKRKTQEEFVKELTTKNPNVGVIGKYLGCLNKVEVKCLINSSHPNWKATANSLLRGAGCSTCYGNRKKTHEEFIEELGTINPLVRVRTKYHSRNKKVKVECLENSTHSNWESLPGNLLKGQGCPSCFGNRKKTHEEFIEELKIVNPLVKVETKYSSRHRKLRVKCLQDDSHPHWEVTPGNLLKGQGCPSCSGNRKKTHEEFIEELKIVNPLVRVETKYSSRHRKLKVKCLQDDSHPHWEVTPGNLLKGNGCPSCSGNRKKTHEEFIGSLLIINPSIKVVGEYRGVSDKVEVGCLQNLSHINWRALPSNLLKGKGCPRCSLIGFNPGKMSYVYLGEVEFKQNSYYKVGLCNTEPFERLKRCHKSFRLITCKEILDGTEAQALEKKILLDMAEYRTDELKGFLRSGFTEILTKSPSLDYFT